MYKYKIFRYIFRAFNLIIYAVVASVVVIAISNVIYISDIMNSIFHGYFMDSKRSLLLAAFLLGNMLFILFFKLISKKETEALLYYICDFIIRITFSIPVSFIVFYFLLYRFMEKWFITATSQAIVFLILFAIFDYLMRWQIKFQLKVNYFKIHDRV
ncbi:MAG: hypothetical protein NC081_01000 [Roseburia sp.]|nr:hypothetical protein [Roseburia sp.]